jgi:peptidoglycan-associated lipoprotein
LNYAEVLMNNSKYSEAKQQLQAYLGKKSDDKRAANLLAGCDSAQVWMTHPVKGNLENMQALNSPYSDWGTAFYNNQFIFASDRPYDSVRRQPFFSTSNIRRRYYGMTGNSYLHLYQSNGKDSASARLLNKGINGDYHSANATYSADGKEMYYAVTTLVKKGGSFLGKDQPYTLNIEIRKSGWDTARQAWGQAVSFPYNEVFKYSVGDPWIAPDGQTLYFTADHGDEIKGGTDIFYTQKDMDGKWQAPKNMGPSINTEGNERTPYFDEAGNFYFASDGRAGMGGLDIYKAVKSANGEWLVVNLGAPVNSPQDDFAAVFKSNSVIYFSSNRLSGTGSDDIYRFDIAKILLFTLEGTVRDRKTNEPLRDAVVTLQNKITQTPLKTITDGQGRYTFKLDSVTDYDLSTVKTAYTTVTGIPLTTKGLTESQTLKKDVYLDKIELKKPVKLENIYFDLDKWNIRPDAAEELDKLVKLLKDNPTWDVEMSSHTDSRAPDAYNIKLSQRRAESTVKYLVEHGIDADRLSAKGYGETRLVNKCSNGVPCTEEEHQENRRTEFTILDK